MPATLTIAYWTCRAIVLIDWMLDEPFSKAAGRAGGVINDDMTVIRRAWMRTLVVRENQFMDGQLLGQVHNSSSFFASSNLILIAAAAGMLFHGVESYKSAATLVVIKMSSRELFEGQLGLIALTLARGRRAFIC